MYTRSLKISQRIEDLRRMLSQFGVDVKTSKSAVLSEATDYIAHLQRQHAQSEAERARILQLLYNARSGSTASAASPAAAAAGRPAAGVPFTAAAVTAAAAAATAATGTATTTGMVATAAHGRTVKPPPTGAPVSSTPSPATGGGGGAAAAATMQQQQQQQQMDDGFGGEGGLSAQAMMSGSLLSLGGGDSDIGRPPAASSSAAAAAVAGVTQQQPHQREQQQQQQQVEVVPGFPGLSAAARSGVDGIMPLHPSAAAATRGTSVPMGSAATGGGGGETAAAATAANLGATARALSHVNYERVFRTAPMPMAIANVNGNLVDCNTRLSQATGFRRDEVLFMTIFDLVADPFLQHTFRYCTLLY